MDVEVPEGMAVALERQTTNKSRPPWFGPALALMVLGGLVARLAFVSYVRLPRVSSGSDANFYRITASNLADGLGYVAPAISPPHQLVATATHPPLFPGLLSVFDLLGIQSVTSQRLALAVVTSTAVLLVGLLGCNVAGPVVGIVAAAIAAFDPLWIQPTGALMSESIYLIVVSLMLLQALRCLKQPSIGKYVFLGVILACAVLIRTDAIEFVLFLGLPLVILTSVPWRNRGLLAVALVSGLILVLGPWLIRNEIQIGGVVVSDQQGLTMAGSYCSNTFNSAGPSYGSFSGLCALANAGSLEIYRKPPNGARQWTDLALDRELTHVAEQFARQHLGALPRVILAREASTWGLGNHSFQLSLAVLEGRNRSYEQASWTLYWVMVPFALIGVVVLLRRSWRPLVILLAPVGVVIVTTAIVYGSTRIRMAAEPSLAVLAATGGVAAANWIMLSFATVDDRRRRERPTTNGWAP